MSLLPPIARFLEELNTQNPITGTILTIGWQWQHEPAFHAFDNGKVISLDASDFEGAEIIHDLNYPLPDRYYNIADFVFDGGCLDNIFNPAQALQSFARLLRVGGRLMTFNLATMVHGAYTAMSPEWLWDYLEHNQFSDIRLFVCPFIYALDHFDIFEWKPGLPKPTSNFIVIGLATKTPATTSLIFPIQEAYRHLYRGGRNSNRPKEGINAPQKA